MAALLSNTRIHARRIRLENSTDARLKAATVPFAGFCSFACFSQLYENNLLLGSVSAFNYSLHEGAAHLAVLIALALAGLVRRWTPSPALTQAFGFLGAAGMVAQLSASDGIVVSFGAAATGASLAGLAVAWGARLARQSARIVIPFALGAFLLSMVLCLLCFQAPGPATAVCAILTPVASGALHARGGAQGPEAAKPGRTVTATHPEATASVSWPLVATLGMCCFLGYAFAGMTLNPYCFQSASVSRYLYSFAISAFLTLLAWSLAARRPKANLLFIAPLALLLTGLLLLSTGVLGSIIMPLGLILAARTCCLALCWAALAGLARERSVPPVTLYGLGFVVCDGTLGRSLGQMASSNMNLSFPDIALAASACIVALALLYALATASHLDSAASAQPRPNAFRPGGRETSPSLATPSALAGPQASAPSPAAGDASPGPAASPAMAAVSPAAPTATVTPPAAPTMSQLVAEAQRLQEERLDDFGLTKQEQRVARLVLQNMTYQDIAEQCGISLRTVKFHAKNLYRKAGAENRHEFELRMRSDG
ncbi:helix-turn-helix transcriptional regulator [Rubneribacter sp.]